MAAASEGRREFRPEGLDHMKGLFRALEPRFVLIWWIERRLVSWL